MSLTTGNSHNMLLVDNPESSPLRTHFSPACWRSCTKLSASVTAGVARSTID